MTETEAIVVTFNSAETVSSCVIALRESGVSAVRVLDNASADDTRAHARSAGALVRESTSNVGFGAAVNALLADVTTEFALIVNPDCIVTRNAVRKLVDVLEADPNLAAVAPRMRYPDGGFGIAGASEPSLMKELLAFLHADALVPATARRWLSRCSKGPLRSLLSYADASQWSATAVEDVDWVCGCCMLVRVEAVNSIAGFDENFFLYFEDVDLCRRLRLAKYRVGVVRDAIALHFESRSTSRVGKRALYAQGMERYFRKHGRGPSRLFVRALAALMRA